MRKWWPCLWTQDLRYIVSCHNHKCICLTPLHVHTHLCSVGCVVCGSGGVQPACHIHQTQGTQSPAPGLANIFYAVELLPSSNVPPSPLSSSDVHLIFNLVNASTSFRSAESWTPLCLPKFNDTGFLHAHVSYLPNDSPACLLLISTDKEKFFALQECQQKIFEVSHVCVQLLSAQSQPATFESECWASDIIS